MRGDNPSENSATDPIYGPLRRGGRYRVCKSFRDVAGHQFTRGEIVTFVGYQYATYSQLDLFYWLRSDREVSMKLDGRFAEDLRILRNLDAYFERIDVEPAKHPKKPNKAKLRKARVNRNRKH